MRRALLPLVLLTAGSAQAEEALKISGSVRLRYETLEGQARAGFGESDDLVSLRTVVLAEYRLDNDLRVAAELYDSRAWGSEPDSAVGTGEVNTLEFVQAYVAGSLSEPFGLKGKANWQAGRFTLNLGSRRLVAADDYRNTTNGYTGLRGDFTGSGGMAATLIYVLPQTRRPEDRASILDNRTRMDRESVDTRLWGGVVSASVADQVRGELTYIGFGEKDDGGRPTRDRHLHSFGGRILREPAVGRFDYEAEAVVQTGTLSASMAATAPRLDVRAGFVHLDAGYSFRGPLKARLSLEYDWVSGDGPGGRYGRFDTLYGMRRADFAPAGVYAQIGRANISTPGVRLEIAPDPRWDAFAVYRPMWLAERTDAFSTTGVRDASGRAGTFSGHQLEGRFRYWVKPKKLRAEINAAWIAKGRFLTEAPNAPRTGDTRYVSLALTGSF
ncbi:alginate export family protein [Asticcacaulis sp. AND118]|uniref:alginate export family protein n=1 Tax=Asticcacaulis sp. AND118 TaxID=2840468 RepID=UPI001CFFF87B|nr:alginate export family protein [Asticcacaulis sp. AND118]UDF03123.1 alginate export family protein [Asticcacaulis sp. AND118]